jgi:hypothetical protein
MAVYKVKLKCRQEIASGTMEFHFEKPEGFSYKAGQCGDFTLANPPETDAEGNTRAFTLASAPYEGDLMVATRMRDTAFKRVLKTMAIGTEVSLDGPSGSLTLHNDARIPAVFRSGLQILAAHPRLNWNVCCTPDTEWLRLTWVDVPKDRVWTKSINRREGGYAEDNGYFGELANI